MYRKSPILTLMLLSSTALVLAGCGESEPPESTRVIAPPSAPTPEAPAGETPAASPEQPQVAAAESAPAESVPAETQVAAAKPAETPAPAAESAADGRTFKGRVVVNGPPPQISPITPTKDPVCLDLGTIPNDAVVIGEDGGLADVFVWIKRLPKGIEVPDPPKESAVLDQKSCRFRPHAQALQIGQPLLVKNDDPTLHNTHTVPFVNSPGFNQGIQPKDREGQEIMYRRAEIIPVTTTCDIHPWMKSYHLPVDHPWAAVTDEHGRFMITNLPEGELQFGIWHGSLGWIEKTLKLEIPADETVEQEFTVEAGDFKL